MTIGKKFLLGTISASILAGMVLFLVLPANSVHAATLGQTPPPPQQGFHMPDKFLEGLFMAESARVDMQSEWFTKADQRIPKIEERIAKLKEQGKDTAALEAALAAFKVAEAGALSEHQKTLALVASHAGFDSNGKVNDAAVAKETLKSIRESLKNVRQMAVKAIDPLREALRAYREANPPPAAPASTETPTL